MGIGSAPCAVPNLSKSIERGNPRRTHPKDAGAEPFVSMVTGEMGPGIERGRETVPGELVGISSHLTMRLLDKTLDTSCI